MPLDPQIDRLLALRREAGLRPASELTPAEARTQMRVSSAQRPIVTPPEACHLEDFDVPVERGRIKVRHYSPTAASQGSIVYYHGGGWVLGDLDTFDQLCLKFAVDASCDLFSVDYRLAPEHRFPVAADDAYAALVAVAGRLPSDRKLVVAGDSAGGNLAAVTAQRTRDGGGPPLALQVLIYPITDHDFETPSYRSNGSLGYILRTADMQWFWQHYVPDWDRRANPYASPLRAADFSDLAPALVIVAEYDVLRDEGVAYAERLQAAGVPVELREFMGAVHGFMGMLGSADIATAGAAVVTDAIRAAVGFGARPSVAVLG
jgi:acetyl esterase